MAGKDLKDVKEKTGSDIGTSLWHRVSEQEKEEIKKNAKKIMDDFGAKLEKISVKEKHFESGEGLRDEGSGWETDAEFRSTMFSNAPNTEDDLILAEKGGWK